MAGQATARRTETGRSHPARSAGRGRAEPVFPLVRAGQLDPVLLPAILTLGLPCSRDEPATLASPAVVIASEPPVDGAAPAIVVPRAEALVSAAAVLLPVVETDLSKRGCPHPVAARVSLSIVASMLLHAGAAAAFVWLSWTMSPPISAGEEGIPVELVVAADTGSASQQEAASGREEPQTPSTDRQALERVEAPPVETSPEVAAREPAANPSEEPPVAQPDPTTTAERIVDRLPPPPMPEHLPIIDRPASPVLADARSEPVREEAGPEPASAQPVQQQAPAEALLPPTVEAEVAERVATPDPARKVETEAPTAVQVAAAPQPVETPPPPVQRAEQMRPPVRREATRPPPTRRAAPTTRERTRPTHPVAAGPQPERSVRAVRQVDSRASLAERGEDAGQRNRRQSNATGPSGASSVAAVAAWRQRVLAHLARFKVYPEQARDRGIRGRTGVSFTLSGTGAVTAVSIASSSGAAILDQATLAMVRRAQPFPPNPAGGPATFTAGVNYSLY